MNNIFCKETFCIETFEKNKNAKNLNVYGIQVDISGQEPLKKMWRSDDYVHLYSCSKTFTSLAVGIAQDEGLLNINDPLMKYFEDYIDFADDITKSATIRDTLHMASGKEDNGLRFYDDCIGAYIKQKPVVKVREKFIYNSMSTYMLSCVVERVSGANLRDYLKPRLFNHLDIFNPQWFVCPAKHTVGGWGLNLKISEFAKLGQVLLHKGTYNGKRIVSEDYINAMQTDLMIDGNDNEVNNNSDWAQGYGYQIWKCNYPNTFRADGMYGQFCIVFYDLEMVITITSHHDGDLQEILDCVYASIKK